MAIELEGGVSGSQVPTVDGELVVVPSMTSIQAGEEFELRVSGKGLRSVNALSFAIPYDAQQVEYVGIEVKGMKYMRNLTYDRLHSNGQKALYPTFVNIGWQDFLEGDSDLMVIRFKAKQTIKVNLPVKDIILVDKDLNEKRCAEVK